MLVVFTIATNVSLDRASTPFSLPSLIGSASADHQRGLPTSSIGTLTDSNIDPPCGRKPGDQRTAIGVIGVLKCLV